jgi:2-iminobutanoate/2-iminopropanoate deaminase
MVTAHNVGEELQVGGSSVTEKTVIQTADAPASAWAFSQGIRKGSLLQVSGQGPQSPTTGEYLHPGDVRGQTRQVLENVAAILAAGGASVEDLVMVRVYLTKREDFAPMNEVYGDFVRKHAPSGQFPCRTTVFVGLPHESMLVEIDALATLD